MWKTWVWFLGWEDPLEKGMGTYYNIFVWKIPWSEEPGRLQSMELQRDRQDWATNTFTFCRCSQYSILYYSGSIIYVQCMYNYGEIYIDVYMYVCVCVCVYIIHPSRASLFHPWSYSSRSLKTTRLGCLYYIAASH